MLTNKELGKYLEEIRKSKQLSLRQVDYQSDVSYSHLSMIEKGVRKASPLTLKELAKIYNLDYIDLYEKAGYIDLAEREKINNNSLNKLYMCPVYGRISAGIPNWAEECIEGRLPIDPVLFDIINPEEHFFLRVNGESMNKVIKNGAFALIHKQDIVENGEIAVVLVNGYEATLKKFSKQNDLVILEPQSNDDSFETQVYDKTTSIKILGKYIGKFEMK